MGTRLQEAAPPLRLVAQAGEVDVQATAIQGGALALGIQALHGSAPFACDWPHFHASPAIALHGDGLVHKYGHMQAQIRPRPRKIDASQAVDAFGALAQPTRLAAFRRLVEAGPDGVGAGILAAELGTPHNTLSTHLAVLTRAGLVTSRREGRSVIYGVDFAGTQSLLRFLVADCCKGRPELCAPVASILARTCC